ncbi:cation:proton antiporter [Lentzea flava]|uniref:NhaP-type Na+/H+ or K+/H+ antiporter n=1 Tax=Lentzea flava TaxID=103732 RepID=A0ABQ2V416_9PSEU|nr:cation:proton antiporter [Lentzea flava]MCP2203323.1 NhaP-type Na+/H+ or K+/H+ antiporter [Lentzea flava]GGU66983.1 hypothetical protein GCM10010178_68470 [Lentzea flava]
MTGAVRRSPLTATVLRLLTLLLAALAGLGAAHLFGLRDVEHSSAYFYAATALLAIGLYGSTNGIDVEDVRRHLRIVVLAVTVGVLMKAALIATVMYLVFPSPAYVVFAVAVAQIDPLSTAAAMASSRLSERARNILAAWSSFDDPITMLLTVYLSAFALGLLGREPESGALARSGLLSFGTNVLVNLAFAAAVAAVWLLVRRIRHGTGRLVAEVGLVVAALAVGVWQFLMLGVALVGLVVRPRIDRVLGKVVQAAFVIAALALGVLLVGGVQVWPGVVLGLATFFAQVVVGLLLTRGLTRKDRTYLAFAQQNGITAITLTLLLEPDFPGAVAVVAPAILVVNVLHALFTGLCDRYGDSVAAAVTSRRRPTPAPPTAHGC